LCFQSEGKLFITTPSLLILNASQLPLNTRRHSRSAVTTRQASILNCSVTGPRGIADKVAFYEQVLGMSTWEFDSWGVTLEVALASN
jgi:hypothetical protein